MIKVDVKKLKDYLNLIFESVGVPDNEAEIISEMLVEAEQRGVHSHGIVTVPRYVRLINQGYMKKKMEYDVVSDFQAVQVWDGKRSNGQVLGYNAMNKAIEKAKTFGIGVVAVKHANHFGAGAYYAQMAEKAGMIGIALSTGDPTMAPWGGAGKMIGNNPIAIAVPTDEEVSPVLDMAQSVVANGKISNLKRQGAKEIPEGWGLDKDGKPTTNIDDFYSVTPLGGYKGWGTALMIDIISGVLFGGGTGFDAADKAEGPGQLMMAWNIEAFRDKDEFLDAVDARIKDLKSDTKAAGFDEILVPGEIEARSFKESEEYTNVIDENLEAVFNLAEEIGIGRKDLT